MTEEKIQTQPYQDNNQTQTYRSKKQLLNRWLIYSFGTFFLAAGITLHTKTALGVSPLVSLPYSISKIWELSFPMLNFIMYLIYLTIQFILNGKERQMSDLLQIPFAIVFNLMLQLISVGYDSFMAFCGFHMEAVIPRIILLAVAISLTGIGISMMVSMKIIPNPGDGLAKSVAYAMKKNLGFGKNLIDFVSVALTCATSIIATGHLVGVGVGTIAGMIFVGRCVAVFNHFFLEKMLRAAGERPAASILPENTSSEST